MSDDRTVLRKGRPKFGINEVAYARAGAVRGFLEPLKLISIDFDPARNTFVYRWGRDLGPAALNVPAPFVFAESELLTLCEALDIQIPVLTRDRDKMQAEYAKLCPNGEPVEYVIPTPTVINNRIRPQAARFGYNEVVYLRETSEVLGRLEAYRITDLFWDNASKQWAYKFFIKRRPGRTSTVGDRGDMTARSSFDLVYLESQLVNVCEATHLALQFCNRAVARAMARRASICGVTDG